MVVRRNDWDFIGDITMRAVWLRALSDVGTDDVRKRRSSWD